jgi:hypothetical protein
MGVSIRSRTLWTEGFCPHSERVNFVLPAFFAFACLPAYDYCFLRDVQFPRDALAAYLDFVFVHAGGGEVVGKLHSQPRFLREPQNLPLVKHEPTTK